MSDINDCIIRAIDTIINDKLKNSGFVKMKQGVIKEVLSDNKYRVQINQNILTVDGNENKYKVNDVVNVLDAGSLNRYIVTKLV